jgi:hypothetical protein
MVISQVSGSSITQVHKTEVVPSNLNPEWQSFSLTIEELTGGEVNSNILFECFDYDEVGANDLIGSFQVILKWKYLTIRPILRIFL